jgi:hypothetical protein
MKATEYTVTANGKVMYRTSYLLGGTDAEAQKRASEVAALVAQKQPAATILVVIG